jgi:hypothetical protein
VALAALQGIDRCQVGWSLARLPPFLAFVHLFLEPQIQRFALSGLWIRPAAFVLLPRLGSDSSTLLCAYRSSAARGFGAPRDRDWEEAEDSIR